MAKLGDAINKVNKSEVKGLEKSQVTPNKLNEEKRTSRLQSMVTFSEKEAIRKKRGYQSESDYIRELIIKDLSN